jgi:protein-tyrosine-phosphatase
MSEQVPTITCVCTANICRSPMAEKLLMHALAAQEPPLREIQVTSSGVSAVNGQGASGNSVQALASVGLDLKTHRSKQITARAMSGSLAVFCMTETHRRILRDYFPHNDTPIHLMREFMPPPADVQIPDPYGMPLGAYIQCRDSMVEAIPSLIKTIRRLAALRR